MVVIDGDSVPSIMTYKLVLKVNNNNLSIKKSDQPIGPIVHLVANFHCCRGDTHITLDIYI